jgi:hypothetical protein
MEGVVELVGVVWLIRGERRLGLICCFWGFLPLPQRVLGKKKYMRDGGGAVDSQIYPLSIGALCIIRLMSGGLPMRWVAMRGLSQAGGRVIVFLSVGVSL